MTLNASARREAALHELNPLPSPVTDRTADQVQQDEARLLELAMSDPRLDVRGAPRARAERRRASRRGSIALVAVLASLTGGSVAVATTGGWDQIAAGWSDMTGHDPRLQPAAPRLVARGTGSTSATPDGRDDLQLWVAPTADGGQCSALRAAGYSLDTCRGGHGGRSAEEFPAIPLAGLGGQASYRVAYTSRADYLWGHVDPGQISTIRLSAPDREPTTTKVDGTTGYWVTSIIDTNAASVLTVTASDAAGAPLRTQDIAR